MERFSVLMSVYKNENPEWMQLSMNSIFNQTVNPSEVVLVVDGPLSPELDSLIERLKSQHAELRIVPFKVNRGLGWALHDGLKHCTYDLVARMDTDDIALPTRFEKQLRVFEEHSDVDVCSAWLEEFEGDPENVVGVRRLPESHEELYEFGKTRNPMSHPVTMFRKYAVLMNGNYQDYPLFEDYFLWARMLQYGCKFYCIQESLLKFRRSPEMIKRRGGLKYALTEFRFQCMLYGIRYITFTQLLKNCAIRFTARIVPNKLRSVIYKQIRK